MYSLLTIQFTLSVRKQLVCRRATLINVKMNVTESVTLIRIFTICILDGQKITMSNTLDCRCSILLHISSLVYMYHASVLSNHYTYEFRCVS